MHALTVAAFAYGVGVLGLALVFLVGEAGGPTLAQARWNQWTNVFLLWPTARALLFADQCSMQGVTYAAAYGEAAVFFVAYAASVLHHGCVPDAAVRTALARESFVMLALGGLVATVCIALVARRWQRTVRMTASDELGDASWRTRAEVLVAVGVLASVAVGAGLLTAALAVGPTRIDGCMYPHDDHAAYLVDTAPNLVLVWDGIDCVTSVAALGVAVLWMAQVTDTLALAALWLLAIVLSAGEAYRAAGLADVTQPRILLVAGAGALAFLACQALVWCTYPRAVVRHGLVARYDWPDLVASLVVGAAAVTLFYAVKTGTGHGWWHVLGALGLYFAIEALYRRRFLLFVRRDV